MPKFRSEKVRLPDRTEFLMEIKYITSSRLRRYRYTDPHFSIAYPGNMPGDLGEEAATGATEVEALKNFWEKVNEYYDSKREETKMIVFEISDGLSPFRNSEHGSQISWKWEMWTKCVVADKLSWKRGEKCTNEFHHALDYGYFNKRDKPVRVIPHTEKAEAWCRSMDEKFDAMHKSVAKFLESVSAEAMAKSIESNKSIMLLENKK